MISSAGIGSGLDVNSIVQQLLAIERQPIRQLQTEQSRLQTQISAFGRVQGSLSTFRDAATKLANPDTWSASAATSSDSNAVAASSTGGAQAGSYTVAVSRLAAAQTLRSATFANAAADFGSGTLRIEMGDFDSVPPVPKADTAAVEITIEPGASSLANVRDSINAADSGVVASIINDVTGARLVLRSAQTGMENSFRVQVLADNGPTAANAGGLSALAFDPSEGVNTMARSQPPSDAVALVNNIEVRSSSNTIDGAVEGLTLTLRKQDGVAEIRVEPDTDALKKSVDDFVKAYDESIRLLREQTRFDPTTRQAGPLQGDRSSAAMLNQLRGLFTGNNGASSVFGRLADVGLSLGTDGLVQVDETKLSAALSQGPELRKLFANVDSGNAENQGFAGRFKDWLKLSLDTDGTLDSRTQSLQARVRNNEQAQERLEDRVTRAEERLRRQYTALDTRMGALTGLQSYVAQQFGSSNNGNR